MTAGPAPARFRLEPRAARLLLAAAVVATAAVALRYYDGHDFINNVWAPTHGLLDGRNPYDPADVAYQLRYRVPVVAGLYLPAALLLHAPLALLGPERAADAMAVLNTGLIWLGVLLLIPPRPGPGAVVAAGAGALVVLSAAAQDTIGLGQLSGWAFAGLALLVASRRRDPESRWLPALGAALAALKPQSGIPLAVALAVVGEWRVLARAAAMLVVASLPGAVLFARRAGGIAAMWRIARDNVALLSRLPPDNLADAGNLRVDALGVVAQLHGPALTGPTWMLLAFLAVTALFCFAYRSARVSGGGLAEPFIATLVAVYITAALYHLMYDQLPLYVGPLAAFGLVEERGPVRPHSRAVAIGGVALLAAGVVFRAGMRNRLIALGLPPGGIHRAWVAIPTLLGVAMVVSGLVAERRRAAAAAQVSRTAL